MLALRHRRSARAVEISQERVLSQLEAVCDGKLPVGAGIRTRAAQ